MDTIKRQIQSVRAKDGTRILQTLFLPEFSNNTVIIIGASAHVRQDFYTEFASFLAENNFTVITFDYRGIGLSKNNTSKDTEVTLRQWGKLDIDAIILSAKNQFSNCEIVYLGHQVGGEIIGLVPAFQYIHRIILVASGLPYWSSWTLKKRLYFLGLRFLAPILGHRLRPLSNVPMGVIRELGESNSKKHGLLDSFAQRNLDQFYGAMLAYSFKDDPISSEVAVQALLDCFPNATKRYQAVNPTEYSQNQVGHLSFFSPELATTFWQEVLHWLNNYSVGG